MDTLLSPPHRLSAVSSSKVLCMPDYIGYFVSDLGYGQSTSVNFESNRGWSCCGWDPGNLSRNAYWAKFLGNPEMWRLATVLESYRSAYKTGMTICPALLKVLIQNINHEEFWKMTAYPSALRTFLKIKEKSSIFSGSTSRSSARNL